MESGWLLPDPSEPDNAGFWEGCARGELVDEVALAEAIAAYLNLPLAKCMVRRFADMEIFVEMQENVRGQDMFVVQSTSFPANDHLMELLIIIDTLRRASAQIGRAHV